MSSSLNSANNYIEKAIKTLKIINNIVPSDKITAQIESLNKLSLTINRYNIIIKFLKR